MDAQVQNEAESSSSSSNLNIASVIAPAPPLPTSTTTKGLLPFHSNPDILDEICEYLAYDYDLDPINLDDAVIIDLSRRNLLHIAQTCKAFLEPALDRLWRSLDSLFPLLKILPAFIRSDGTYVLRGAISDVEWARFDRYARRVRRFSYSRDPDTLDIAMHVYFRLAQLHAAPILPSLRHLHCPSTSQIDFLISGICLFLSPSLQTLEFENISNVEDKLCGTVLHTLFCDGAEMEKIILRGRGLSSDTVSMVVKFEHLRELELAGMGEALSLDVLEQIGALPWLVDLALDFTDSNVLPLLEKDIGLRDLKSLMLTAPVPFIKSFLPRITATTLETFVAACPSHPPADKKEFLEEVVERWGQTLRRVALVHQQMQVDAGGAPPDVEVLGVGVLEPLLPLKRLTYLRLEGYAMEITDDDVMSFARAWPDMTNLLLPFIPAGQPRPSISSLRVLAQLSPKLRHLRIPLNTSDPVPTFVSPGVPHAPGHEHELQVLTVASGDESWELRDLLHFARHVDYLFPRLRSVFAYEGGLGNGINGGQGRERDGDANRWVQVNDLIMMYQAVRREAISHLGGGPGP